MPSQDVPNRLYIKTPGLNHQKTRVLAHQAVVIAQKLSPKLSGRAAQGIKPFYGNGYFGLKWDQPYLWWQEEGIHPFTMTKLAGKTIPMWIDDPLGREKRKNPKAKTRITASGRRQVLIFRKAAQPGQRKRVAVRDSAGRLVRWRDVPASYPGAPGRIERREHTSGRISTAMQRSHGGVRWRHPGLMKREFLHHALQQVAIQERLDSAQVKASYTRRH